MKRLLRLGALLLVPAGIEIANPGTIQETLPRVLEGFQAAIAAF